MKNITFRNWTIPLALLVLCLLSYGLLLPWLGFYQDDWALVWFSHFFGPRVFIDFFARERPFLAGIYMLTTSLVGSTPLAWQAFGILTRWLAALAGWWSLHTLWPRYTRQITWITFLFIVYPGFKQQFASVVYSQDFIILAAFLVSLGSMLLAVRSWRWRIPLTLLSLFLAIFTMFSSEYFFGMELLRPAFLWIYLAEETPAWRQRLRRTLLYWMPYLLGMLGFVYWRMFIFKFVTYEPKLAMRLSSNPALALFRLAQLVIEDSFEVSAFAWWDVLDIVRATTSSAGTVLLRWALVFLSAPLAVFYLSRLQTDADPADKTGSGASSWAVQATLIGLLSLVAGGWPFWFTGLSISLEMPYDRFSLAFMFGVSILLVGLIDLLMRTNRQKIILIGLMCGLAIALHVKVANSYRQVRSAQSAFFHQMSWRIPGLKPQTVTIMNTFPYEVSGAMSLTSAQNWIYASQYEYPRLFYRILFIPDHLGNELPDLQKGLPIEHMFRSLKFTGSTSQAIVAYFDPPRCLQVFDPQIHASLPKVPPQIGRALPLSDLSNIVPSETAPARRMQELFGDSQPDWCYYFEKADLARQLGDWPQAAQLADQAFSVTAPPDKDNALEFLPFIEAYAHQDRWEKASRLTRQALTQIPLMRTSLCETWTRIQQNTASSAERDPLLSTLAKELECSTLK